MLKKLLKYEFAATARYILPLIVLLFVMSAAAGLCIRGLGAERSGRVAVAVSAIFVVLFFLAVIALAVVTLVVIVYRFYRSMLSQEGYLTHSLPVSIHGLLCSKLIAAAAWFLLTGACIYGCLFAVAFRAEVWAQVLSELRALALRLSAAYGIGAAELAAVLLEFLLLLLLGDALELPAVFRLPGRGAYALQTQAPGLARDLPGPGTRLAAANHAPHPRHRIQAERLRLHPDAGAAGPVRTFTPDRRDRPERRLLRPALRGHGLSAGPAAGPGMRRAALAALAAACLLLSACAASGPAETPPATPTPAVTPAPTPEPTPEPTPSPTPEPTPPPTLLGETEDMGQEYQDAIVFYGDSNTNGLRLQELLPGGYNTTQVWTPMSGTLTLNRWSVDKIVYPETWEEMSVTEAMALKRPEYLIVNLGENGVSFMDEEYFKEEYTALVRALGEACPETKIMCASLFPVAESYPYQGDINNDKLAAASAWIYEIAEAEGLRYIDLAAAVRGEDGSLPEDLHIGDGYHLNSEAHGLVLDYIRTHAYR